MSFKQKINIFWLIFATRIRIRFIEVDSADHNETDPDPKHCFKTMVIHT